MMLKVLLVVVTCCIVVAASTQPLVGQWSNWTSCSRSCDGGVQTRSRWNNLQNTNRTETQKVICKSYSCESLTRWNDWTACSKQCGGGARTRSLRNPATTNNRSIGAGHFQMSCNNNPCLKPENCDLLDVLFLLDSSGSMGEYGWWRIKQLAIDIVRSFSISQYKTRVGLVTYSSDVETVFHLNKYSTTQEIEAAIWKAEFLSGGTDTTNGLRTVMQAFAENNGDRPHIPNLLIWVTDGVTAPGAQTAKTQALAAKKAGITIIAVAVGWLANSGDLWSMVSSPARLNVVSVGRLTQLHLAVPSLTQTVCRGPPSLPYKNKEGMVCCTHSGDPHTRTFDGSWLHYQGTCKYNLASTQNEILKVHVKQENRNGNTRVSYVRYLDVHYHNTTIRMERGRVLKVDTTAEKTPYNNSLFSVSAQGGQLVLSVPGSFEISYDGVHAAKVCVRQEFSGQMKGLCGNADGDRFNDLTTANGTAVKADEDGYKQIGDSLQVPDKDDQNCSNRNDQQPSCSADDKLTAQGSMYCGLMEDKDGPFSQCLGRVPATGHVQGCILDVCSNTNSPLLMKALACNALSTLEEECKAMGATVGNWVKTVECSAGVWGEWGDWSVCSAACRGTQERHRKCMTSKCAGYSGEIRYCGPYECDGWSDWTDWGSCSVSCDLGYSERTRSCLGEPESCEGEDYESQSCNQGKCPVVVVGGGSGWDIWTTWSACSVSCGAGTQHRTRECMRDTCEGNGRQNRDCNVRTCPDPCSGSSSLAADPTNCAAYYLCRPGGAPIRRCCRPGSQWNQHLQTCLARTTCTDTCVVTSPTIQATLSTAGTTLLNVATTKTSWTTKKTTHTRTIPSKRPSPTLPTSTPQSSSKSTLRLSTIVKQATTKTPKTHEATQRTTPSRTTPPTAEQTSKLPMKTTLNTGISTAAPTLPPTAPPVSCYQNYSVYLPLDEDFNDRSCRHMNACPFGHPKLVTIGSDKVASFDGQSYLELQSFNLRDAGHYIEQMTITVRFKVTRMPHDFAVILSNGEIDTRPSVDVHIDSNHKIVAGINFVYFTPQQASKEWIELTIVFNKTGMVLYINGQRRDTKNNNNHTVLNTQFPLRIGGGSNGWKDGYLTGFVDKVTISEQASPPSDSQTPT